MELSAPTMRSACAIAAGVFVVALVEAAPPAAADCTSAGGTTICSQGEVRGANTGNGPSGSSGPYMPYPCDYDWYCNDGLTWGVDLDFDPGIGIGAPGRPGDRPGGGGRPGGGRGGRR